MNIHVESLASHLSPRQRCRNFMLFWCAERGIKPEQLTYQSMKREHAWPRQAFMLSAHKAGHSKNAISEVLEMDRSTVQHGIQSAAKREAKE